MTSDSRAQRKYKTREDHAKAENDARLAVAEEELERAAESSNIKWFLKAVKYHYDRLNPAGNTNPYTSPEARLLQMAEENLAKMRHLSATTFVKVWDELHSKGLFDASRSERRKTALKLLKDKPELRDQVEDLYEQTPRKHRKTKSVTASSTATTDSLFDYSLSESDLVSSDSGQISESETPIAPAPAPGFVASDLNKEIKGLSDLGNPIYFLQKFRSPEQVEVISRWLKCPTRYIKEVALKKADAWLNNAAEAREVIAIYEKIEPILSHQRGGLKIGKTDFTQALLKMTKAKLEALAKDGKISKLDLDQKDSAVSKIIDTKRHCWSHAFCFKTGTRERLDEYFKNNDKGIER